MRRYTQGNQSRIQELYHILPFFNEVLQLTSSEQYLPNEILPVQLLKEQLKDPNINKIYNDTVNKRYPLSQFFIDNQTNILCLKPTLNGQQTRQPIPVKALLSESLLEKAITIAHSTHYRIAKIYELFNSRFHFRGLFHKVSDFVKSCRVCIEKKQLNIPKERPRFVYVLPFFFVILHVNAGLRYNSS